MAVKRGLVILVLGSRAPLALIWRVLVHPTLLYGYRGGRLLKKWLGRALAPVRRRIGGQYAVHTLVVVLSILVSTTNLQARELPLLADSMGKHSIMSKVSGYEMEDLLTEQAAPTEYAKEVAYLGAHAVRARSEYVGQVSNENIDPSEDVLDEPEVQDSVLVNAIRVQTSMASTDEVPKTRSKIVEHVVAEGENIGSISRTYDLDTLTILSANDLSARSIIRPGQKLKILPVDGIVYSIKRGDTLVSIANKYKSDAEKILEINQLADAGSLSVGEDLILPGGKLPPPPAPTPSRVTTSLRQVFTPAPDSGSTRLLWPTSARRVTQYYNWRHQGVDIAAPIGTPIYAADDGVVSFSGWNNGGYGLMVLVDHQNGLYTRYAHASRNLVSAGDVVKRGDVIQLMGSTGRSTGPHIHFEVLSGGVYNRVNPFDYIQ
ncbi:MAG: M23 family metallopeptidase [Patescibacteria group bacterium]